MAWTPRCSSSATSRASSSRWARCRGRCRCSWAASRTRRTSRPSWTCDCRAPRWSAAWGRWSGSSRRAIPHVHWLGVLPRDGAGAALRRGRRVRLPQPRRYLRAGDGRGHGRGTPVAAYPVDGPLEVLGRPNADGTGRLGGAMHARPAPGLPGSDAGASRMKRVSAHWTSAGRTRPGCSWVSWCLHGRRRSRSRLSRNRRRDGEHSPRFRHLPDWVRCHDVPRASNSRLRDRRLTVA